jgi:RNA 2',3'-cyclic 3'-phosphodiesterase
MHCLAEPTQRLFIGLFPPAAVLDAIAEHCSAWRWPPGSRPTPRPRLHLTLHFLGNVDAARQAALQAGLGDVPMLAMDLVLGTPQCWRGGVAVLRPDDDAGLRELRERLAPALQRAGLAPARGPWMPHLTLARHADQARPPEVLPSIAWRLDEFVLVWSRLAPSMRYEVLQRRTA